MKSKKTQQSLQQFRVNQGLSLQKLRARVTWPGKAPSVPFLWKLENEKAKTSYGNAKALVDFSDGAIPLESLVSNRTLTLLNDVLTTS